MKELVFTVPWDLLGAAWDLGTTDSRAYDPTQNWGNLSKASQGGYKEGYKPSYELLPSPMRLQVQPCTSEGVSKS